MGGIDEGTRVASRVSRRMSRSAYRISESPGHPSGQIKKFFRFSKSGRKIILGYLVLAGKFGVLGSRSNFVGGLGSKSTQQFSESINESIF